MQKPVFEIDPMQTSGSHSLFHLAIQHGLQASTSEAAHTGRCTKPSIGPTRRQALLQLPLSYIALQASPADAAETRGIGRYIKKKALDPLVTCVCRFVLMSIAAA